MDITILPTILIVVVFVMLYFIINKVNNARLKVPFLSTLLILFMIFLPLRVYIKDSKKGHRASVEYYPIKNTFTNLAYLVGSILPKQLSDHSDLEQKLVATPAIVLQTPDINIVMIMGKSLNINFMSLYDYKIKTTPFLGSLKNKPNFLYKKSIAGGVVTDVSIPSFFNMIKRPDGVPQIITTNTCLFKMAKLNGFNTYFYSSQSRSIIST